ncbi:unnamed protein product [Acanthoscelides obtectus]|uniref:Uncharacterized protein n=1 Tax=Acanthoscelides obtectus TaxID=200917 RepID=A0A9P0KSE8_ACAOB|nr:unnamed protein product [Acanthoscelides obtectus]CAK1628293.1 hypothetical protein AOBTE_LOCUS5114 [Acanthoscelides obtectus]
MRRPLTQLAKGFITKKTIAPSGTTSRRRSKAFI